MNKKSKAQESEEPEGTKAKDGSRDRLYFIISPRLVWALCEDSEELALWIVIKDIAGEDGECILSREDLALLAMQSTGSVSIRRDRLIRKKLLEGELRRDPGYPQSVWHLRIPDFWEANIRWARMYPKLSERVSFKRAQFENIRAERRDKKESSLSDGYKESSLSDGGGLLGDGGRIPGDAKKIVFKDLKEESNIKGLRSLFSRAADIIFSEEKDSRKVSEVKDEIDRFEIGINIPEKVFIVSGLSSERAAFYKDRYKRSLERAFIGLLAEEVSIEFLPNAN
jgi:hypothetical protein